MKKLKFKILCFIYELVYKWNLKHGVWDDEENH